MFSALLGSSECLAYLNPHGTASLFGLPQRRPLKHTLIIFRAAQGLLGGDGLKSVSQLGKHRTDERDLVRRSSLGDAAGNGRDGHSKFTGTHRVLPDAVRAASAVGMFYFIICGPGGRKNHFISFSASFTSFLNCFHASSWSTKYLGQPFH